MEYQAIALATEPAVQYDPSDKAEIQRIKERGDSDITAYDEWGPGADEDDEIAQIQRELGLR